MATAQQVRGFSICELASFVTLKLEGQVDSPESIAAVLKENKITGKTFLDLTTDELREMIPTIGDRKVVKGIIDSFSSTVVCNICYSTRTYVCILYMQNSRHGTFKVSTSNSSASNMIGGRSSQWLSNFCLPQFSTKTMQSLEAQKISKGMRIEMVTALAFEIWNHTQYPTGDEYNSVCSILVNKYPFLKDTIGNGYVSVYDISVYEQEYTRVNCTCVGFMETTTPSKA